MSTGALFINDRDVETDFSFYASGLAGWPGNLAGPPRSVPLLTGPEMSGAIVDPRLIQRGAATATVTGVIVTASAAAALVALDALRALLGGGEVKVRTFYASDRECFAICTGVEGGALQPEILDGNVSVSLSFVVPDGTARRLQPDGYALTTSRTSCPIGAVESRPAILVHGGGASLTNPVVTIRNAAGDIVQTMGFTVVLGANEALRIDGARCLTSKIASGVVTDAVQAGYWTSGDYPVLRPYDGWVESAVYPTVELSSSGGVAQGLITYERAYA